MSTDSTELTFVRCPSCRSLVPAVSTRCRMCGASLESSAEMDEEDKDKGKSGRVRQRTMSQPQSNLSEAANELREAGGMEEKPVAVEEPEDPGVADNGDSAPEVAPAAQVAKEVPQDDPLSAFIEEVEVEEEEPPVATAPEPIVETAPEPIEKVVEEEPPAPEPVEPQQKKQRVFMESGPRKGGAKSGLSFGNKAKQEAKPAEEAPKPKAQVEPKNSEQPRRERPQKQAKPQNQPKPKQQNQPKPQNQQKAQNQPKPQQQKAQNQPKPQRQQQERRQQEPRQPAQQQRPVAPQAERVKPAEGQEGRLYGWLVSFDDPAGSAIELREGKFFVAASSIKEHDIVIDHASVSTPHALMNVSASSGVHVQDLLIENGVSVRRSDGSEVNVESEVAGLEHGDWVRFGDVEFLVSLLPQG